MFYFSRIFAWFALADSKHFIILLSFFFFSHICWQIGFSLNFCKMLRELVLKLGKISVPLKSSNLFGCKPLPKYFTFLSAANLNKLYLQFFELLLYILHSPVLKYIIKIFGFRILFTTFWLPVVSKLTNAFSSRSRS